jgi:hypothetical protein
MKDPCNGCVYHKNRTCTATVPREQGEEKPILEDEENIGYA